MLKSGCWIFLSHSGKNIDRIREIRNELERLGNNPLAFYLRCLSDDTEEREHELFDLIEREIDAREWFIICDSPEARESEWVKKELKYIVESGKERIFPLDITGELEDVLNSVRVFCEGTKVYVTYSHMDEDLVHPLIQRLVDEDYSVWEDKFLEPGMNFAEIIPKEILESAKMGFHIAFLTENTIRSPHCMDELIFSYNNGGHIIPVIVGNPDIRGLQRLFEGTRVYHYESNETIDQIVGDLDKILAGMAAESIRNSTYKLIMEQYGIDLSEFLQK